MNDTTTLPALPDRLSVDPSSKYYAEEVLKQNIGIKFNDKERSDVEEYCISEGWIKVAAGKALDRKGRPLMIQLKGKVEAFYQPKT
jgi:predicted house-cleaning NTP pyrophosphatase (Maf/HAM1 superfamily)